MATTVYRSGSSDMQCVKPATQYTTASLFRHTEMELESPLGADPLTVRLRGTPSNQWDTHGVISSESPEGTQCCSNQTSSKWIANNSPGQDTFTLAYKYQTSITSLGMGWVVGWGEGVCGGGLGCQIQGWIYLLVGPRPNSSVDHSWVANYKLVSVGPQIPVGPISTSMPIYTEGSGTPTTVLETGFPV